jgi:hypothetical protein
MAAIGYIHEKEKTSQDSKKLRLAFCGLALPA